MGTLCQDYSGIAINQNAESTGFYALTSGVLIYQTFMLPGNYGRGTNNPQYPDISGLQFLVNVTGGDASTAALTATLQYYLDSTWFTAVSQTATGAPYDGSYVWFDVIFASPLPVTEAMLSAEWRVSVELSGIGINSISYVSPTPIVGGLYESDGVTPLVSPSASLNFRLLSLQADSGSDFLGNEYRSLVVSTSHENVQTTGGLHPVSGGGAAPYWMSQVLPSPTAVESLYFDVRNGIDAVVIDSVLVDPVTPNMSFNVYYSTDDTGTSSNMSSEDWDNKLWSRVQRVYRATTRQQYVLPTPVLAKYIKIEFTNPQAQSYDPGSFQTPVVYQQFPTWVENFFRSHNGYNPSIADVVNVQFDALELAYGSFANNLIQTPDSPPEASGQTSQYWSDATGEVDITTLDQINLNLRPYQAPLGAQTSQNIVSVVANNLIASALQGDATLLTSVEGNPDNLPQPNLTLVSSSFRDDVLLEQTMPDMYFYLTCRHAYKQSTATFEYNRGYVFAVNEVAFMRHNYSVADDTPMYIESGQDELNISVNDFTVTPDGWFTYAS